MQVFNSLPPSTCSSSLSLSLLKSPPLSSGLCQDKISSFVKRFRSEPRYLLAQNVSTCIDPLEVCLHRQTVQDTVHIFQHSIPTEGKPVTNQKNSGIPQQPERLQLHEDIQRFCFEWPKIHTPYYSLILVLLPKMSYWQHWPQYVCVIVRYIMTLKTLERTHQEWEWEWDKYWKRPISHLFIIFPFPGRCWIFSCLNVMRLPFMKKFNIEEFEFSQSYLFFWDKVRGSFSLVFYLI